MVALTLRFLALAIICVLSPGATVASIEDVAQSGR